MKLSIDQNKKIDAVFLWISFHVKLNHISSISSQNSKWVFFFKCLHTRKNNCSLKLYQATKWCVQLWYWSITIKPLCCWFVHYTFDYYNVQRSFETAIPLLPYMAWPYVKQLPLYVLIISKTDSRRYCIIVIRGRSRSTVNWKFFVAGFILKWTNYETNNLVQLVRPVVFCNTHSIDITYNSNVFFFHFIWLVRKC